MMKKRILLTTCLAFSGMLLASQNLSASSIDAPFEEEDLSPEITAKLKDMPEIEKVEKGAEVKTEDLYAFEALMNRYYEKLAKGSEEDVEKASGFKALLKEISTNKGKIEAANLKELAGAVGATHAYNGAFTPEALKLQAIVWGLDSGGGHGSFGSKVEQVKAFSKGSNLSKEEKLENKGNFFQGRKKG